MKKFLCFCLFLVAFTSIFSRNSLLGKDNIARNLDDVTFIFHGETNIFGSIVNSNKIIAVTPSSSVNNTTVVVHPTCNGASTGSITITAGGGTAPYTYSINGGTSFQTSNVFNGLAAGTYSIVTMDAVSSQSTASSIALNQPTAIATSIASVNENCGSVNGSITITASGGTGTLQYSNNGGTSFQASNVFPGLSAANYTIVVEDGNGCQATSFHTVGSNPGPALSSINKTDASCNGGSNGTITVNATGTATLLYSNNNGTSFQTSNVFSGLTAGAHMIVVEDGNGCQTFAGTVNITQPAAINLSSTSINENCGSNDGSITATGSGGVGTLQYSINGGTSFQSNSSFTGLAAGGYNIIVEDGNGCQNTTTQSVSSNGGPIVTSVTDVDATCNGGMNGSINISATGLGTLQYSINGGTTFATTSAFTGLASGSYNVMVEDVNGCQTTGGSITIGQPSSISISSNTVNENCGSNDGSITITASGGTGTLQYSINGGVSFQSSGTFNGQVTGLFAIVVEDVNGCQSTASATVGSNSAPTISGVAKTDETCFGANDGTITITATGAPTMLYSTNGGSSYSASPIINGLGSGAYDIQIEDGNGCQTSGSTITITSPLEITYSALITDENCGNSDGEITLTANNNLGTTTYSINGGATSQSSNIFTGLSAGSFNVLIEDVNGCFATGTDNINNIPGPTITAVNATDLTCFGLTDGSINITATLSGTIQYSIDGGSSFDPSPLFGGLAAGNYNILVQNGNGCSASSSAIVNSPLAYTSNITSTAENCGVNDGTATISASGGTGTLTYQWDDSGNQTGTTATGLASGNYTVTIEDLNGCIGSNSVTINTIGKALLTPTITDVSCYGLTNGSATITATGGTSPYSFSWNDPAMQTSATANGLAAGTYNVTVTDITGCVSNTTVDIFEPNELIVSLANIHTSCAIDNGISMSTVTGGTPPYTYTWNDANNQTTATAVYLSAGTYSLFVEDVNNCYVETGATINDSDTMLVSIEVAHESCPDESDGSITTVITGGQPPYQYDWSTGDTTHILSELPMGSYTLNVSDNLNCIVTLIIPLENKGGECIKIPTAISPNADGSNDTWVINGLFNYPDAVVEVYNRWGGLILTSSDYQNDWGGTYNGEDVAAGVYYFVVTIDEETTYTGSLTVIR